MKKTLFMGALALTIATSMVAGTMAVYTHADTLAGTTNDTGSAKKFYINSTAKNDINIKLAPGNEEFWDFQVTNHKDHIVTEVPMDLKLKVEFLTLSLPTFSISLLTSLKRLTTSRTLLTILSRELSKKIRTSSSTAMVIQTSGLLKLKREDFLTLSQLLKLFQHSLHKRMLTYSLSTEFIQKLSFSQELRSFSTSIARRSISRLLQ